MLAVIAGGSGLLGQLVAAALLERGDEVTILTRRKTWRGLGRVVLWNPAEPDSWLPELEGADLFFDFASGRIPRFHAPSERAALIAERVAATTAICAAMPRLSKPPRAAERSFRRCAELVSPAREVWLRSHLRSIQ